MYNLFKNLCCGLLSVFLLSSAALADAPGTAVKVDVKLGRPMNIFAPANMPGMGNSKPRQWFCLEAKLKVEAKPVPKTGFIDGLTVTFFLAVKDPEQGGKTLLLQKEIKYVNIPVGEDSHVCVYMAPSTIKRLTGSYTISPSMYIAAGALVSYKGADVGQDSTKPVRKGTPPWWTSTTFLDGKSFPLLSHNETPFAPYGTDRFPEISTAKDDSASAATAPVAE